jgi:hypothetical protein
MKKWVRLERTTDCSKRGCEQMWKNSEINAKIDNFLGFEELSEEEKKDIIKLRGEVSRGEYVSYKDVFSD